MNERAGSNAPHIRTVTASTFTSEVLDAPGPVAVEFMSYGCSHCRTIAPIVDRVAESIKDDERIVRVNVGADGDLAQTYGIEATPTFVMFRNGKEAGRVEGPDPNAASLRDELTRPFA
jgi:thioredoxin 1